MNKLDQFPNIVGGSADLSAATKIAFNINIEEGGKNIRYGIRGHAVAVVSNSCLFAFKNKNNWFNIFIFYWLCKTSITHEFDYEYSFNTCLDSWFISSWCWMDPTHQPFDQIPMLRAIYKSKVIRVADENEAKLAFKFALKNKESQLFIICCR